MYNGHKNWNHWNVSLWINNDEGLYFRAKELVKIYGNKDLASKQMLHDLAVHGYTHTPDGAPYTKTSIRAALRGI